MVFRNTKNLAMAMMLKYSIILIYFIALATATSGYINLFWISTLIGTILIIFKVSFDVKFILGEMKK